MSLSLSSDQAFLSALSTAREVDLSAYTLGHGATERALLAAASHGAGVRVRLAGLLYGDSADAMSRRNDAEAALLAAHGVDAAIDGNANLHLKAAIVDGQAFFDDRNWCDTDDVVLVSSDALDVAATRASLSGSSPAVDNGLVFTKGAALREEAAFIAAARAPVCLQTETLGPSTISACLRSIAGKVAVRILVTQTSALQHPRTVAVVDALKRLGIQVRTTNRNDKFCLSGSRAWVGSANASGGDPQMSDWGAPLDDAASVACLQARFDAAWARGTAL